MEYEATMIIRSKLKYFSLIQEKLNESKRNLFRSFCFEKWLELSFFDHEPHLLHYILKKQGFVDYAHYDMPIIYHVEGHVNFVSRVLPNKVGVKVTNLDIVGVIKDEKLFGDLSNEDVVRVCLLLSLEIWILESCEQSILWWNKEPNVIPRALTWLMKEIFNRSDYIINWQLKEFKVITDLTATISELKSDWYNNFRDFFMVYLPRNPPSIYNDLYEDYLNKLSASRKRAKIATKDLPIIPRCDSTEVNVIIICITLINGNIFKHIDWTQEYLIQEEIRLGAEQEESWRLQEQKMMVEVFVKRLKEEVMLRVEKEKLVNYEKEKHKRRHALMNSDHWKASTSRISNHKKSQCSSDFLAYYWGAAYAMAKKDRESNHLSNEDMEAEYMALTEAVKEAIWLRGLLEELGVELNTVAVNCDNQGAIHLSRNHVFHERTKHINVRYHFIREVLEAKTVKVLKVGTEHNAADALTKVVPGLKLQHCLELLNVGVG
ncbi:hypothetical protein Tco_0013520 [Tanacetum coccineum]